MNHKKKVRGNKSKSPIYWPYGEVFNPVYGEMAMWGAVVTQALMDALSQARNAEAIYQKQQAIHWLTGNSHDFITVCYYAGYDPDDIRKKAKKAIANPTPWRAPAGEGKRYLERKMRARRKLLSSATNVPDPESKKLSNKEAEIAL